MKYFSLFLLAAAMLIASSLSAATCLEGICLGDDVENLGVKWKPIYLTYDDEKFVEAELGERSVDEVYFDYNERLVAEDKVLRDILPYVIRLQRFDNQVLANLSKVRAICSSLTLTGEIETNTEDRVFVTFRAVADAGQRGALRVVRLEKQFGIMSAHLRPKDAERYRQAKIQLQKEYPGLLIVRDIDGRINTTEESPAMLGFRFVSDVSNPLVLKLFDLENITSIEEDEYASVHCQTSN